MIPMQDVLSKIARGAWSFLVSYDLDFDFFMVSIRDDENLLLTITEHDITRSGQVVSGVANFFYKEEDGYYHRLSYERVKMLKEGKLITKNTVLGIIAYKELKEVMERSIGDMSQVKEKLSETIEQLTSSTDQV